MNSRVKSRRITLLWLWAIAILSSASVRGEDSDYEYEFVPEVLEAPGGGVSESKFVWASNGNPTNGGVS